MPGGVSMSTEESESDSRPENAEGSSANLIYDASSDEVKAKADLVEARETISKLMREKELQSLELRALKARNQTLEELQNDRVASNGSLLHAIDTIGSVGGAGGSSVVESTGGGSGWLEYPRDFFECTSGASPKTAADAEWLWPFRQDRKKKGEIETEKANGTLMLKEVATLRESLRNYVLQSHLACTRALATAHKLVIPGTTIHPVTEVEIQRALCELKRTAGSLEAEQIVYMVCHEFHRDREWLALTVDKWCIANKIKILPSVNDPSSGKIKHKSDRGGFGAVARQAKAQATQNLMRKLINKQGWSLAVTKHNSKNHKYAPIKVTDKTGNKVTAYVVTRNNGETKEEVRTLP
jgi:hypothetical protein